MFMNPQYSDDYLEEYYSGYVTPEPKWEEPRRALQSFYIDIIAKYTAPLNSLLDIGTGRGYTLAECVNRGIRAEGFEPNSQAAQMTSELRGVPVHSGALSDLPHAPGSFDVVCMHHVLEHLKDPMEYLRTAHSLLRAGGTLFVALPNIASISIRVKAALEILGFRASARAHYFDTSHHLFYFTPGTIRHPLRLAGFDPVYVRGCFRVRPSDSAVRRWYHREIWDRPTWRSGFLVVARRV
jgi:SAM-dependent methyltransferase